MREAFHFTRDYSRDEVGDVLKQNKGVPTQHVLDFGFGAASFT